MKILKFPLTGGMTKRCYVEGIVKVRCPKCNSELLHDMNYGSSGDNYLGYPEQGGIYHLYFCCDNCSGAYDEYEYILPVTIKAMTIELEYDESKLEIE
jgi:hypothetical protein